MPYVSPNFPILCNIFTGAATGFPAKVLRLANVMCNLEPGRRTLQVSDISGTPSAPDYGFTYQVGLLLPKLTDVRYRINSSWPDIIECPAGSGRYYGLIWFDDVAKGFVNEYRLCSMIALCSSTGIAYFAGAPNWPAPTP